MTILDDYISYVATLTDAPYPVIVASAYWLLSSTVGFWFEQKQVPSFGARRCNLFVILSGASGIVRKSTVMEYAEHVYRKAWTEFYNDINIDIDVEDKFIEEFTVEGIADVVEELANSGVYDFVLTTDEFGIWLQRTSSTHLLGSKGLLSKLYYGKGYKQNLSRRDGKKGTRRIPSGLYWTMVAAMQEPEQYLTESDIKQGLFRRFFIVSVDKRDLREYKPPLTDEHKLLSDNLDKIAEKLKNIMLRLYSFSGFDPIEVYFTKRVKDKINEYDRQNNEYVKRNYGLISNVGRYMTSAWEHVTKMTMLNAVADVDYFSGKVMNLRGIPTFIIDDDRFVELSINIFEPFKERVIDLIDRITFGKRQPNLPDIELVGEEIMSIINKNGGRITVRDLLKKLKTTKRQIKDYVITLVEREEIFVVLEKKRKNSFILFTDSEKAKEYVQERNLTSGEHVASLLSYKEFEALW